VIGREKFMLKRKPMLLSNLKAGCMRSKREVIGLVGSHHGAGVTYTGLMLAFFMGEERGKKTAFLECNNHLDMKLIEEAYIWTKSERLSFSFQQITCFREVSPEYTPEVFGEDYECLILDFGIDLEKNRDEFLRCNTKIVVGGRSEWDLRKLKNFMESSQAFNGSGAWLYFIPQATEKRAIQISKQTGHKVWPVPVSEDPAAPSRSVNRFFGALF
jgi:hypothetical protein